MKRKPSDSESSRPARSSIGVDAMRSLLRLAMSIHEPTSKPREQLADAMHAFGCVVDFDVWIAGTIERSASTGYRFAELRSGRFGNTTDDPADKTVQRWARLLRDDVPSVRPLLAKHFSTKRVTRLVVRAWADSHERSLLSLSAGMEPSVNPTPAVTRRDHSRLSTWFSVHRLNPVARAFTPRDRRLLAILHEQAAWAISQ